MTATVKTHDPDIANAIEVLSGRTVTYTKIAEALEVHNTYARRMVHENALPSEIFTLHGQTLVDADFIERIQATRASRLARLAEAKETRTTKRTVRDAKALDSLAKRLAEAKEFVAKNPDILLSNPVIETATSDLGNEDVEDEIFEDEDDDEYDDDDNDDDDDNNSR